VIEAAALLGAIAAVIAPTASPRMLDPGPPEDPSVAGLAVVPRAGTVLADGTGVVLFVSAG
jgi:hypothetical protein